MLKNEIVSLPYCTLTMSTKARNPIGFSGSSKVRRFYQARRCANLHKAWCSSFEALGKWHRARFGIFLRTTVCIFR